MAYQRSVFAELPIGVSPLTQVKTLIANFQAEFSVPDDAITLTPLRHSSRVKGSVRWEYQLDGEEGGVPEE